MTGELLLVWAAIGLFIATFSATAAKVLHEFARHELEELCLKRGRYSVYDQIIETREQLAMGAETLQLVGLSLTAVFGVLWMQWWGAPAGLDAVRVSLLTAGFALVLLATNSWIPWAMLHVAAAPFLYFTWRFWWLVTLMAEPLSVGFNFCRELLYRISGTIANQEDEEEAFEDEIRSMVSEGERDGLLDLDAREMIEGVIELDDKDVGEVMTPKREIIAINADTRWEDLITFAIEHNKTRIPVYAGELNNIIGFLHTKDLLPEANQPVEERRTLRELLRESMFVPESMLVDELLQQFQRRRMHMAIVVDEYGSIAGLVTIEDILEEIVGDIVDEMEPEPDPVYLRIDGSTIQTDGSTKIEKLNDELGWDLPEDMEFDTVGGLMLYQLKDIPENRMTMVFGHFELEVVGHHQRTIERVNVRRLSEVEINGSSQPEERTEAMPSETEAMPDPTEEMRGATEAMRGETPSAGHQ